MKKLCIILILFVSCGTLFGQTRTLIDKYKAKEWQVGELKAEIAELKIIIRDVKADRDALTVFIAELKKQTVIQNQGIAKANGILQKGYNDGKLNYEELRILGFNIVVDSYNVYQRPKPNKVDTKK